MAPDFTGGEAGLRRRRLQGVQSGCGPASGPRQSPAHAGAGAAPHLSSHNGNAFFVFTFEEAVKKEKWPQGLPVREKASKGSSTEKGWACAAFQQET